MHLFKRYRQIIIFGIIGVFNTLSYLILANAFYYILGWGELFSSYLAYFIMLPISFFGHRFLTFGSAGRISAEGGKFLFVQLCNLLVIWGCYSIAAAQSWSAWIVFALTSVIIPLVNFIIFRFWVFTHRVSL
ncbi:GtrA family protein [Ancylobacter gelatini]|uniref:GtrA family protein n=1 Tax=Ancylobacter gelatini TaxID=2919920 RepID=UPI003CC94A9B